MGGRLPGRSDECGRRPVLSRPLLWLDECFCVGLIFDRVFLFVRDGFKILLIIDGVKSQKHRIKCFFFFLLFPGSPSSILQNKLNVRQPPHQ